MASSNKDNSMEYDRQMYKKTEKSKNHLASRLNKFQEKLNQNQASSTPHPISSHQREELDQHALEDIKHLCHVIKEQGQQGDYAVQIKFGELWPLYGNVQLGRLNELLTMARDHGYINFTLNDTFEQERDEDVYIRLIKTPY